MLAFESALEAVGLYYVLYFIPKPANAPARDACEHCWELYAT